MTIRVNLASFVLGILLASSAAHSQTSTKTYEYDDLGRLVEVEVTGGSQNSEQRVYTYDEADNRQSVVSTGAGPTCVLGPFDFTVPDGSYAWPRVYAPTSNGCGFDVQLSYTITVQQPGSGSGSFTHDFFQSDDILGATDHTKMVWINPDVGLAAPGSPAVLHVNWTVVSGNAVIAGPGYSVVTISAD